MKTAIELKANVDDSEINNFALSLYKRRAIYKEKFIIGGENHLCKAKRTDNGKWVEGFYFCMTHPNGRHTHHFIIPLGTDLSLGTPIEKIQVEVDSDTICWCTGLKDKNGKLIWENDIANCMDAECCGYISWNESEAGFYFNVLLEDGRFEEEHIYDYQDCMEVIGNNFDNPELLEV